MFKPCNQCSQMFAPSTHQQLCASCAQSLTNIEKINPLKGSALFEQEKFGDDNFMSSPPRNTEPSAPIKLLVGLIGINSVEHFEKSSIHKPALELLTEALQSLQAQFSESDIPSHQNWQGILLAPEFFFHRSEKATPKSTHVKRLQIDSSRLPHRCLSEEEHAKLIEECKQLSQKHPSTLIVPGSFLYRKKLNTKRKEKATKTINDVNNKLRLKNVWTIDSKDDSKHFIGHSTTGEIVGEFVKVDGSFKRDSIEQTLQKIQDYDYMLRNVAYGFYNGRIVFKYHKVGLNADIDSLDDNRTRTVFVSGGGPRDIVFNGVRIGLEICLDHDLGLLKHLQPDLKFDIHLIISGSVDNISDHFRHTSNGYVIHADSEEEPSGVFNGNHESMTHKSVIGLKTKVAQNRKTLTSYIIQLTPATGQKN